MFEGIHVALIDLDGTVYTGSDAIPGAAEAIEYIRSLGIEVFFFTNNSERNRTSISEKLNGMGISCKKEDVVSSGFMSAVWSERMMLEDIYICGTEQLKSEFSDLNLKYTPNEEDAKNLIIGMDSSIDYKKLSSAIRVALRSETIIACNKERIFPGKDGKKMPGCGAIVSSIEFCSNRCSNIVIGKPNTLMFEYVAEKTAVENKRIVVIGDSIESDMAIADKCHAPCIYVGAPVQNRVSVESLAQVIKKRTV